MGPIGRIRSFRRLDNLKRHQWPPLRRLGYRPMQYPARHTSTDAERRTLQEVLLSDEALDAFTDLMGQDPEMWTELERDRIAGTYWAMADVIRETSQALAPHIQSALLGISEMLRATPARLDLEPIRVDLSGVFDADGWEDSMSAPEDLYAHVHDGLPGLSARCWKDVWQEIPGRYVPCNAGDVSDLGLCESHQAELDEIRGDTD